MTRHSFTEDDEGTPVVNADGDRVGMVSGVRGGTAYVDPDPGLADSLLATLGWENVDEGDYPLDPAKVAEVTDDEIRLERHR